MVKSTGGRPEFRAWVDGEADPGWPDLPLTHVTNGVFANDIVRNKRIDPGPCAVFNEDFAYFFYGRPAYRLSDKSTIKREAACPYCFIFDPGLIQEAQAIFPFDTGAFDERLYKHVVLDEMDLADFSLGIDGTRPRKIIAKVFSTKAAYIDGDVSNASTLTIDAGSFLVRSYLDLLISPGRNEPDDRICSIEILFGKPIYLQGRLKAMVVPHTLWQAHQKTPWLTPIHAAKVEIIPYEFIPNRHPEHYHALLERAVKQYYSVTNII